MAAEIPEKIAKLFQEPNFAHLATIMPDGSPQVTAVWVDYDGTHILVNTADSRQKPRNVRRDPRVAIDVYDQQNPYAWASIRGRVVEITTEGAEDLIDKLAKKYIGQDRYPWRQPGEKRVTFKIVPEHISSMMPD